ncbi:hypothetical protein [Pseudoxanthomonas mexicana]
MRATIGRIVQYTLSQADADAINRRRTTGDSIADRIKRSLWPLGAQAHIGEKVWAGDFRPAIVVREWAPERPEMVNLQVFLDGTDVYWATSRLQSEEPQLGCWNWPEHVVAWQLAARTAGAPKPVVHRELPLHSALYALCLRIEACGASPALTEAVTLASDLMRAVGDPDNPADPHAADRVRQAVAKLPSAG